MCCGRHPRRITFCTKLAWVRRTAVSPPQSPKKHPLSPNWRTAVAVISFSNSPNRARPCLGEVFGQRAASLELTYQELLHNESA